MIQQILNILDEGHEGEHMTDELGMMGFFGGGWWMWLMMIAGMILVPILTIWTYQDAKRVGENAALWALIVFFTMGFGIIVYALVRNSENSVLQPITYTSPPQPSQSNLKSTVKYSPPTHYNTKASSVNKANFCEYCGDPLTLLDKFCSNCGNVVGSN